MDEGVRERAIMTARGAAVAAVYAALCAVLHPISYGPVQFRVAEAMTVLPFVMPEAVPGLVIGCAIANMFGGYGVIDILLGSLATLIAASATRRAPNRLMAAAAPVASNGVIVGAYLAHLSDMSLAASICYVALGEAGVCFGLGIPLLRAAERSGALRRRTGR